MIFLAVDNAASTLIHIHGLKELIFAIHASELDVRISGHGRMVMLVFLAKLKDLFGLLLQLFDLLFDFNDLLCWLFISIVSF